VGNKTLTSETFFQPVTAWYRRNLNLTQQKPTCTNQLRNTLVQNKHEKRKSQVWLPCMMSILETYRACSDSLATLVIYL